MVSATAETGIVRSVGTCHIVAGKKLLFFCGRFLSLCEGFVVSNAEGGADGL